ncbi:MAG: sulfite exporter TauE/SafE family protein [Verrucomicrobia bacterium]|nr:sulfite exporter TauE/SafE family protein [Verrucomicrobiota bacterium]
MLPLITGFLAGLLHVFSGPDHLAAVAPLSIGKRGAWRAGVRWGFGHSSGVLVVGLLALTFRGALPLETISDWSERFVGVVLIGIGCWSLRRAMSRHVHTHEHAHGVERHVHIHAHASATAHSHGEPSEHRHTHAAFAVGTLHGLAGSSHFIGVLPSLAFDSTLKACLYLSAYGAGTVLAMGLFAGAFGAFSRRDGIQTTVVYRRWMAACAVVAFAVGGWWLVA